ncbi:COP9 signalosome complex subunit 3 [Schistocerca nitens]|uniref:COP9 signalosome complex subunit 3 n=1 Tax=Schistocerca nitens TaxID=7011 RepID=UPI0021181D2C|nr:COP9 signalosome complex subunit 3 [Schistocerca nitens]
MASALEQFVNNVRTLSAQGSFRELCDLLNKSTEVLMKNGQHLDNVLETLDLQQHSLGVLAVLCVKFSAPISSVSSDHHELLFAQAQEFITGCNGEQVRFAPDTYAELCHQITHSLAERKMALRGIDLMRRAIRKIQLFDSQLTSVHADLCQLCLLAKCFKPALEFLNTDITNISREGGQFDAKYFLLYYYYGGMIYAALKNYDRALYFFEVAVTTPAMAVSHVMLEAYKKYILVSLILHGKVQNIPKYTSQVVGRFIKPLSQAYHDLASSYSTNNSDDLKATISKYQETFARDSNAGLVKQVLASLYRKNIQRLTKTFLTLSLSDVASRVQLKGPAEAEKYILNMIEDGDIFATINQKDGMVIFHDDPEKYNSPTMLRRLEEEMAVCTDLDRKMQTMEEEIMVNPVFVKKSCGAQDDDLPPATTPASKITTYSM